MWEIKCCLSKRTAVKKCEFSRGKSVYAGTWITIYPTPLSHSRRENVNTGPTDPGGRGGKEKSAPPTLGFPFGKKSKQLNSCRPEGNFLIMGNKNVWHKFDIGVQQQRWNLIWTRHDIHQLTIYVHREKGGNSQNKRTPSSGWDMVGWVKIRTAFAESGREEGVGLIFWRLCAGKLAWCTYASFLNKKLFSSSANRNVLFFVGCLCVKWTFLLLEVWQIHLWLATFVLSFSYSSRNNAIPRKIFRYRKKQISRSRLIFSPLPPKKRNSKRFFFLRRKPRKRIKVRKKGGTVQKCVNVDWYCVGGRERPVRKSRCV